MYEFKNSPHHLRISASSVSALCGLHPYQDLPSLFFDLVYQSHHGQRLLRIDAHALGLTLVDAKDHERETMLKLASTASNETRELVMHVLEVSDGTRKLDSIDDVKSIRDSIESRAVKAQCDGRLSADQVKTLLESTRGHVTTGFGTHHEDDSLDLYEMRIGSRVRERNEALMEWRFRRVVCDDEVDDGELGVTAEPMGEAIRRLWKRRLDGEILTHANDDGKVAMMDHGGTKHVGTIEIDRDQNSGIVGANEVQAKDSFSTIPRASDKEEQKPFFKIVGAVDGMRDELYIDSSKSTADKSQDRAHAALASSSNPSNDDISNGSSSFDDDEDNWTLRPIIVECKHRMKEAKVPPPLYDQIQTCLYCHMYNVEDADLVQVLRRKRRCEKGNQKIENEKEAGVGKKSKTQKITEDVNITVTRVSLNDPIYNHNHHWKATLLPRLASFVDAVYNVRRNDEKRYRLLMARSEDVTDASNEEAWRLLWEECPWLRNCDTAFAKRGQI
ncbi:hypothetical protein ACHAXA_002714 [Cyclostephanos tholiformis]|uniref:Uncharacterized protein n=1 Tax=Cyclostephanos tholiformis TaxID=382380 RepID=A0ABD3R414_9STRA